jgi:hypothetical protein
LSHACERAWGGPLLVVRGEATAAPIVFALLAEAGYAAISAAGLADGEPAIALDRGWVALCAAVGFRY